jgi:hypothetical protein
MTKTDLRFRISVIVICLLFVICYLEFHQLPLLRLGPRPPTVFWLLTTGYYILGFAHFP